MIRITRKAEADLQQIYDRIGRDNGAGVAARISEAILASISYLDQFPEIGRAGRRASTRDLVITQTPYIVIYRLGRSRRDCCPCYPRRHAMAAAAVSKKEAVLF